MRIPVCVGSVVFFGLRLGDFRLAFGIGVFLGLAATPLFQCRYVGQCLVKGARKLASPSAMARLGGPPLTQCH